MAWWLLPAASWAVGALVVARVAAMAVAEVRLLLRTLDDVGERGWPELADLTGRLGAIMAATGDEAARPFGLVRAAARAGRHPAPVVEP
jgi:hypothetical protein